MHTFIENYLHFMENCIRPHYEKLKPLKSGFIENLNFENNRDPCLQKWPTTPKEIDVTLKHHFLEVNNDAINHLSLPALKPLNKRARMDFANESRESQVSKLLRPTFY